MLTDSRSRRARCLSLAATAGTAALLGLARPAHGQQNPADQTVFLNASDTPTTSSFYNGSNFQASSSMYSTAPLTNPSSLAAGTAPQAGYAYVVTGSAAGTGRLNAIGGGTFGGDSLTIIAYNGQANLYNTSGTITNAMDTSAALNLSGGTTSQTYTVADLVLANGGAVIDENRNVTTTLAGGINLVAAGTTLDGITTTVGGGILDAGLASNGVLSVTATLTGAGQLHLISTGGNVPGYIALSGSNANFSGGVLLDNTVGTSSSGSGNFPALGINSPTALGTGTFTILSNGASTSTNLYGPGPIVDNTTAADETLTTNNAQVWNGSFNFLGTHSLNMGGGAVTLASNGTLTVTHSVLAVNSIGGSSTLTLAGQANTTASGALEVPTLAAITSGLSIANGATLAFPAASNTPAQLAGYAQSLQSAFATAVYNTGFIGIDTTGVAGGVYNMSAALPSGSYGLNKVGTGTLRLLAVPQYSGATAITNGTVQLGATNGLGTNPSSFLFLGGSDSPTNGTLDLNGYSALVLSPAGGAKGGLITNSSATPATMTLQQATTTSGIGSYAGQVTGNLSVVVDYNPSGSAPTSTFTLFGSSFSYTGTTTLLSGILNTSVVPALAAQSITFSGGALELGAGGLDVSPLFSQAPNQQYNVLPNSVNNAANTVFATGLNSSGGSLTVGNPNVNFTGTLVLAAANHYTGPTLVNAGVLQAANPGSLANTSGVSVAYPKPLAPGTAGVGGTLQVNDNSGFLGLTGGVAGGAPITLNLNGQGSTYNTISYRTGHVTFPRPYYSTTTAGYVYYGALQGGTTAGGPVTWAGNVSLNQSGSSISGGFQGAAGKLTVTGAISGTGPLVVGLNPGSVTALGGADTYSNETQVISSQVAANMTVYGGLSGTGTTVQLAGNNAIPATSGLNFTFNPVFAASAADDLYATGTFAYGTETFDANGYATNVAYLTDTNKYSVTNGLVTTNAPYQATIPAVITNARAGTTSTVTIAGDTTGTFTGNKTNVYGVPTFNGTIRDGAATAVTALAMNAGGYTQVLTGSANNYSGGTSVVAGSLATGATGTFGAGNVSVGTASPTAAAVLTLGNAKSIADTAQLGFYDNAQTTINLNGASGSTETVYSLRDLSTNLPIPAGTYTAAALDAMLNDNVFASGDGSQQLLVVAAPEPASLLLAAVVAAPLALGRRRRRA